MATPWLYNDGEYAGIDPMLLQLYLQPESNTSLHPNHGLELAPEPPRSAPTTQDPTGEVEENRPVNTTTATLIPRRWTPLEVNSMMSTVAIVVTAAAPTKDDWPVIHLMHAANFASDRSIAALKRRYYEVLSKTRGRQKKAYPQGRKPRGWGKRHARRTDDATHSQKDVANHAQAHASTGEQGDGIMMSTPASFEVDPVYPSFFLDTRPAVAGATETGQGAALIHAIITGNQAHEGVDEFVTRITHQGDMTDEEWIASWFA